MNRVRVMRGLLGAASFFVAPPLLALTRRRDVAPIFLYHRVSPVADAAYPPLHPDELDRHCAFLAKTFRVLRLSELIERALGGAPIRGCAAITFDDGYRDFREYALPILARHGLPVTHFLVADCVDHGRPPWTYRLNRIARSRKWASDEEGRQRSHVASLDSPGREAWLADMTREPAAALPPMLGADDIRAIDGGLVDWGSHTGAHGFLDLLAEPEVRREVGESRERLEAITGTRVRLLAYPNGRHDAAAEAAASRAGYDAALAVSDALLVPTTRRFAVPRFDVTGHPTRLLRLEATGLLGATRRLRGRVAVDPRTRSIPQG